MLIRQFRCHDCGSTNGYRSRPRSFAEKYLYPLLLLRPVRCAHCFRRDNRSLLIQVPDRIVETQRAAA